MIEFKRDRQGIQQILNSPEMTDALRAFAVPMADQVRAQHPDAEVVVDDYTARAKGRFTERAATSVKILDARGKLWEVRDGILTRAAGAQGLEVRE